MSGTKYVQNRKRTVYISVGVEKSDAFDKLKRIFNECGFWLEGCIYEKRNLNPKFQATYLIFSEQELVGMTGKKGYRGWVGKEIQIEAARFVVFPPVEDFIDPDLFERSMKLLMAVNTSKMNVVICTDTKQVVLATAAIQKMSYVVVDFETKGRDPFEPDAKILTIAAGNDKIAYVVPVDHKDFPMTPPFAAAKSTFIKAVYNHPSLVAHNAKFEIRWFMWLGFPPKEFAFDPMVVHHLLHETSLHDLGTLAMEYTQYAGYEKSFESTLKSKNDYESAPFEGLCQYNGQDVIVTALVMNEVRNELEQEPRIKEVWEFLDRPLIPILAEMENNGFTVNQKELDRLIDWYEKKKASYQGDMKSYGPAKVYFKEHPDFNFNSFPQKTDLFYEHLKFPIVRKTEKGAPSTDELAVKMLRGTGKHKPFLDAFVMSQKTDTMLKSFLRVFKEKSTTSSDGRLHTNYNMHVVETFRLSSSKPNMQNPPRSEDLLKLGLSPIKSIFESRLIGGVLQADLSQIELRLAGSYTGDPPLLTAYQQGRDLHGEMAAYVYGPEWDKEQRYKAKRTNFSAVFDIGPESLSEDLEITVKEAEKLLAAFRKMHPILFEEFGKWWDQARFDGYIENAIGRKRHIAFELANAFQDWEQDQLRRSVWNMPIQSSAADIMKLGLQLLHREFKKRKLNSLMIGTIHDSVIVEYVESELELVATLIKEVFEEQIPGIWEEWLKVPIKIDISCGINLHDLEEVSWE